MLIQLLKVGVEVLRACSNMTLAVKWDVKPLTWSNIAEKVKDYLFDVNGELILIIIFSINGGQRYCQCKVRS